MRTTPAAVLLAGLLAALPVEGAGAQSAGSDAASEERTMPIPRRLFVSGHSLTNEPLPSDLAAIASGFGLPLAWNRQHIDGSSIKQRSRGSASGDGPWAGYAQGVDRTNQPIDVLAELRRDQDAPYDTLLITEQHGLLGSFVWHDTVTHLRDFQDRFAAHNPAGITYFYDSWLSLDDKSNPARWIAYERAAAPVWQCIVARIDQALVADGRRDRMLSLPAASALAYLIEQATQGSGIAGITRENVRATIDSLVSDDVHLTPLGSYYIALVTFAFIFRHPVDGAWHPAGVTAEQARALQAVAGAFVQMPRPPALSLEACRSYVRRSFLWTYLGYNAHWHGHSYLGSLVQRARLAMQWWWLFSRDRPENPFSEAAFARRKS
jgi:hypothetical protein